MQSPRSSYLTRVGAVLILAAAIFPISQSSARTLPQPPRKPPQSQSPFPFDPPRHFVEVEPTPKKHPHHHRRHKPRRTLLSLRVGQVKAHRAIAGCDHLCERVAAVGYWARARGYAVREHPLFGGVCYYCHAYGSAHYVGHAIDINWNGGDEMSRLDWLYEQIHALPGAVIYWRTYGHWDHLHFQLDY